MSHRELVRFLLVILAFASEAGAATREWTGGTSAQWSNGANWSGGTPVNGDDLLFRASPAFQPSNNDLVNLAPNGLLFSNAAAMTLGGNGLSLGTWSFAAAACTFGRVTGTATATNPAGHGLAAGQLIVVSGAGSPFDGLYAIATAPSATTFTFAVNNSGATTAAGNVSRGAALENLNTTSGRDVTIGNPISVTASQNWNSANANAVLLLAGNISGTGVIAYSSADTRAALPALRLAGTNSAHTGNLRPGSSITSGLLLMHPAAMIAGNIDLGSGDRSLWIQSGSSPYTFGVGTGTNAVSFRNAGQGGLKVHGGDATWDPGNGGDYSLAGNANPRVRFSKSLVNTNTLYFGNNSSRLVLSTFGFTNGFADSGSAVPPIVVMRFALSDDGAARPFTVGEGANSTPGIVALTRAASGGNLGGKTLIDASGNLAVSSMDQLFNGNLEIKSGTFVANGITWNDFAANRTSGYGTGANQWQLTGGGFSARGTSFVIPNDASGGLSDSTFDQNFQLGLGLPGTNENLYANRPVTIGRNTTLTGRRTITLAHGGAGLTGVATAAVVPVVSAALSGTGSVVVAGFSQNPALHQIAEILFSGTNTWSGSVTNMVINTGFIFNSGPGGLHVRDAIVRFDGDASLPSGNGGNPALLGAVQRNAADFGFGFLFSGGATEKVYDLPSGMRFMIGAMSTAQDPGLFGAGPGLSRIEDSTVLVHDGNDSYSAGFMGFPMVVLVRDGGTFALGDPVGGSLRFVASKGQDAASSLLATTPTDAVTDTNRTLIKRGEGTVVLRNVAYTDVAESGNKSAQFFWYIGRGQVGNSGAAAYFDGAVRGLAPNDAAATTANSLKNMWISLRGGVYEIDNSGGGSGTFNRWVTIAMGSTNISLGNVSGSTSLGGAGFAAYGGDVIVDLQTNASRDTFAWSQPNSGFIQGGDPLLFGSQTANATIEFYDGLNLSAGTREVRVIDNTNAVTDRAVISGPVSGTSASTLLKTGNGVLELRGTNVYAGGTIVSNGLLIANSGSASATGTNTVTIAQGAAFAGAGTVSGAVTLASGSTLHLGTSTNFGTAHLRVGGALSLASQTLYLDISNAGGTAGTDWDLLTVGGGSGQVTLSGTPAVTLVLRATNASLPGFAAASNGTWLIVDAGSVSGFATNSFTVNTAQFAPTADGVWSVTQSVGNLFLSYAPNTPVDLSVTVSQSTNLANVGDPMTYTIVVSNAGPVASPPIVLSNRLGNAVTYIGSSGGPTVSGGSVVWTSSGLDVGSTTTYTLNVNAALVQGAFTNRTVVSMPSRVDPATANNSSNLVAYAQCPGAPTPVLVAPSRRTVQVNQLLSFSVVASNSDCSTPFLEIGGNPGGTFTVTTNGYSLTGLFQWTPLPGAEGTHPLRVQASNVGSGTNTMSVLIHVASIGEPTNQAGVPLSQTNWAVAITALTADASGVATVRWDAVEGVGYDIWTTTDVPGSGVLAWTRTVSNSIASSADPTGVVPTATRRYVSIMPTGIGPATNGLWGIVQPAIAPGASFLAAPLLSDRSFAAGAAFGSTLAAALTGHNSPAFDGLGDEAHLLQADGSWITLYLNGSGAWIEQTSGLPATNVLAAGQGLLLIRNAGSSVTPRFSGAVGNTGVATNSIAEGWNLVGLSEGRSLAVATAFDVTSGGSPVGDYDEMYADLFMFLNPTDGTWKRLQRLPDGTWLDLQTFTASTHRLLPAESGYYFRQSGAGTLNVRF